jgi:hypothetical protein
MNMKLASLVSLALRESDLARPALGLSEDRFARGSGLLPSVVLSGVPDDPQLRLLVTDPEITRFARTRRSRSRRRDIDQRVELELMRGRVRRDPGSASGHSARIVLLIAALVGCDPSIQGMDTGADAGSTSSADGGDSTCKAPQIMVLLDRTGTMHRDLTGATPLDTAGGHASAKLTLAIQAIEGLMASPGIDQALRLGLATFPRDPGSGCLTLSQRLSGSAPFSNPACEVGDVPIAPALGTAAQIASYLDPETTTLCNTTPTGSGLLTARDGLTAAALTGVKQYVMLVTDGADFYDTCPTPDPLDVLRQLDAQGIPTFIVGFGAQNSTPQGVNPSLLNRMACAGHTAKNFATSCVELSTGGYDAVDPDGAPIYYDAADGAALSTALTDVARQVCCGCVL